MSSPAPPSRRGTWLTFLLLSTPIFAFWTHDFYRYVTKTGLYATEYQGSVVKLRPTMKHLVELIDGDHDSTSTYSDDERNLARYEAVLTADDGTELEVGLSRRDFSRATAPGYLVCRSGKLTVYASRAEAEAAEAVTPRP